MPGRDSLAAKQAIHWSQINRGHNINIDFINVNSCCKTELS
jgi:hypothetical protein